MVEKRKRKQIDWEAIEKEYRLGQKTLRTIAAQFNTTAGAISKKAKSKNWYQDKSKEVRQKTKAALLKETQKETGKGNGNTPTREDIDVAVQTNVEVIRGHRKDISQSRAIVTLLSSQLQEFATERANIEEDIIDDTKGSGESNDSIQRRNRMLKAVSLPSHAGVLKDLSMALKNLIPLERQAFNLDEEGPYTEELLETILASLPREFAEGVRKHLSEFMAEKQN